MFSSQRRPPALPFALSRALRCSFRKRLLAGLKRGAQFWQWKAPAHQLGAKSAFLGQRHQHRSAPNPAVWSTIYLVQQSQNEIFAMLPLAYDSSIGCTGAGILPDMMPCQGCWASFREKIQCFSFAKRATLRAPP